MVNNDKVLPVSATLMMEQTIVAGKRRALLRRLYKQSEQ
jgi:hypothetical protein